MRTLFLSLLLISSLDISAQSYAATVDSITYSLYAQEEWRSLIRYGRTLSENDRSPHFVRMRLGIAHYELGQFYRAELQFQYALENGDPKTAREYLYWIYQLTGREPEVAQ